MLNLPVGPGRGTRAVRRPGEKGSRQAKPFLPGTSDECLLTSYDPKQLIVGAARLTAGSNMRICNSTGICSSPLACWDEERRRSTHKKTKSLQRTRGAAGDKQLDLILMKQVFCVFLLLSSFNLMHHLTHRFLYAPLYTRVCLCLLTAELNLQDRTVAIAV